MSNSLTRIIASVTGTATSAPSSSSSAAVPSSVKDVTMRNQYEEQFEYNNHSTGGNDVLLDADCRDEQHNLRLVLNEGSPMTHRQVIRSGHRNSRIAQVSNSTLDGDEGQHMNQDGYDGEDHEAEEPVQLHPRFVPRYEEDGESAVREEIDTVSSLLDPTCSGELIDVSSPRTSHGFSGAFFRQNACPTMPTASSSSMGSDSPNSKRGKPTICRSLAWSQDEQEEEEGEEQRFAKRKRHNSLPSGIEMVDSFDVGSPLGAARSVGQAFGTSSSTPSRGPTIVHWEQQLTDPMDLANVIQRAIEVRSPNFKGSDNNPCH